jgi:hypothetical protein
LQRSSNFNPKILTIDFRKTKAFMLPMLTYILNCLPWQKMLRQKVPYPLYYSGRC